MGVIYLFFLNTIFFNTVLINCIVCIVVQQNSLVKFYVQLQYKLK